MAEVWEQMYAKLKKNPVFLGSLISKLPKQNYRGDSTSSRLDVSLAHLMIREHKVQSVSPSSLQSES